MTDTIISDNPLTSSQRSQFDAVLDLIIPADPTRSKPSAKDVGVFEFIRERDPNAFSLIAEQLDELEAETTAKLNQNFVALTRESQEEIVSQKRTENPRFLMALANHTTTCYYLNAQVMAAIGLPARPPYPEGFTVPRGDLNLLSPVRERKSMWRCSEIEQIKANNAQ